MTLKTKILRGVLSFLVVAAFFVIVSWASGYDFDHRNEDVGFAVCVAMLFSILAVFASQQKF